MKRPLVPVLITLLILASAALSITALAAPVAQEARPVIAQPAQDTPVRGVVQIVGSAVHPQFQRYELYYAPWPVPSDQSWIFIGDAHFNQQPLGLLGTWDSRSVTDGAYALRVRVVKQDGNYLDSDPRRVLVANTRQGGINAVDVTVRGFFSTISKASDDASLRLPLTTAQELMRADGVHRWIVMLDDTDETGPTMNALTSAGLPLDYQIVPWHELADYYVKAAALLSRQLAVVTFIIAAIVVQAILNSLTTSIFERTAEIGTSKALGVSSRRVLRRFVFEAIAIGLAGLAVGLFLGIALALAISEIGIPMPPSPGMDEGYIGRMRVIPSHILQATWIVAVTAFVGGFFPAYSASRMPIADALRCNR